MSPKWSGGLKSRKKIKIEVLVKQNLKVRSPKMKKKMKIRGPKLQLSIYILMYGDHLHKIEEIFSILSYLLVIIVDMDTCV